MVLIEEHVDEDLQPSSDAVSSVQLGYCVLPEELDVVAHRSANYNDWDGGQVSGGVAVWLNPEHIPSSVQCRTCCDGNDDNNSNNCMQFICQLYAPLDDHQSAFHRTLYVFACPKCSSVRVLKSQLPQENPYYPAEPNDLEEEEWETWNKHTSASWNVHPCRLCGCRARGRCPVLQEYFCGKQHQKEAFQMKKKLGEISLPPLYELVVEEEEAAAAEANSDDENDDDEIKARQPLFDTNNNDGQYDSDEDLEQEDLNEMTGRSSNIQGGKDHVAVRFQAYVQKHAQAVLRYHRWSSNIMWCRQDMLPPDPIPACQYCGAERKFEFQLLPQMLHYITTMKQQYTTKKTKDHSSIVQALQQTESLLQQAPPEQIPPALVEAKQNTIQRMQKEIMSQSCGLDWGVVAVYTCTASCNGSHDYDTKYYQEEYAFVQPSLY